MTSNLKNSEQSFDIDPPHAQGPSYGGQDEDGAEDDEEGRKEDMQEEGEGGGRRQHLVARIRSDFQLRFWNEKRERKKIITNDLTRVKKITPGQRFKAFQVLDNSFEEERLFILLEPELLEILSWLDQPAF